MTNTENVDLSEIDKFSELASRWWDETSEFKPLHAINPLRLNWIKEHCSIDHQQVLDIGCGGGILSESLARSGGQVKGIDLSKKALQVAKLHALETNTAVEYELISAEDLALLGQHHIPRDTDSRPAVPALTLDGLAHLLVFHLTSLWSTIEPGAGGLPTPSQPNAFPGDEKAST